MCGRYSLTVKKEKLSEVFSAQAPDENYISRNVSPTMSVLVLNSKFEFEYNIWGLIPSWSKDKKKFFINARAETILEKPSFKQAFLNRRCLIPADGFYEWKKLETGLKQPYHFTMKDDEPFALAGIWEVNKNFGTVPTCSILTCNPNSLLDGIHDRMPVIIKKDDYRAWLDPEGELSSYQSLLRPYLADEMCSSLKSPI